MSYTAAWIIWLLLFGAIEGHALIQRQPDQTLSAHIWQWLDIRNKPGGLLGGWNLRRGALAIFLLWLLLHLTRIAF